MSYHAQGALTLEAPQAVKDAKGAIEQMLVRLQSFPADWASKVIFIGDAGSSSLVPFIDEDGYIAWPNSEFKKFENAWATLSNHLGLVGLEWRFALRNLSVTQAIKRTNALLIEARKVIRTGFWGSFPWKLALIAAGAALYFSRGGKFRKARGRIRRVQRRR